jgi:tRNA A-37 threonylcarbamoyl transferase component Bud32/ActR/RegA family two-component response regulator
MNMPPTISAARACLIVHDDLALRLQLAALARRAWPTLAADCVDRAALSAMAAQRLGGYSVVILVLDFASTSAGSQGLAHVARLRESAPRVPIIVLARGGDERSAARSIKAGALDYWPIHSVKIEELREAFKPAPEHGPHPHGSVAPKPGDGRRQPEIAGYRLLKKIAQSAAATVYLAQNDELGEPVALKVQAMDGLRTACEADRARFARECDILSALNHRAVANVLDFGMADDYLFLALEYFPCGSLRERMRNPLSEADAVNYVRQIGHALEIVHRAHVVHCDLKPSNIMLTDDNRIVLIDFGSARGQLASSGSSRTESSTGTPYYVSPEQIAGREPDGRSDLYSLGVLLFEMLSGTLPFDGKTLAQILAAHRSASVPNLPMNRRRYQPVVHRLMAKSPDDRYADAGEFLRELNAAAAAVRSPVLAVPSHGALNL